MTARQPQPGEFYAALAAGDLAAVLAILGDDINWYEAAGTPLARAEPYRGAAQIAEHVLGPLSAAVPDLEVSVERVIALGRTTAVLGAYTRSTQRVAFVHVWRSEDDRLVEFRQFTDVDGFGELMAG